MWRREARLLVATVTFRAKKAHRVFTRKLDGLPVGGVRSEVATSLADRPIRPTDLEVTPLDDRLFVATIALGPIHPTGLEVRELSHPTTLRLSFTPRAEPAGSRGSAPDRLRCQGTPQPSRGCPGNSQSSA